MSSKFNIYDAKTINTSLTNLGKKVEASLEKVDELYPHCLAYLFEGNADPMTRLFNITKNLQVKVYPWDPVNECAVENPVSKSLSVIIKLLTKDLAPFATFSNKDVKCKGWKEYEQDRADSLDLLFEAMKGGEHSDPLSLVNYNPILSGPDTSYYSDEQVKKMLASLVARINKRGTVARGLVQQLEVLADVEPQHQPEPKVTDEEEEDKPIVSPTSEINTEPQPVVSLSDQSDTAIAAAINKALIDKDGKPAF